MEISGEIYSGYWIDDWVKEIRDAEEDVEIEICSPGGDVLAGMQIANAIMNCRQKVTARINTMACSAAAVIALACDRVNITKNDIIMLHNCWTFATGTKEELLQDVDAMKAIDAVMHNIIREHCNDESISERMNQGDVYLTGEEAAEIFDNVELVEPAKSKNKAACVNLAALLIRANANKPEPKEPPEPEEYEISDSLRALLAKADKLGL